MRMMEGDRSKGVEDVCKEVMNMIDNEISSTRQERKNMIEVMGSAKVLRSVS